MKENIQTGNTGISQDKIGTAADDNTVLFCCELKNQLFLSLVNSIMGTEIACRVIQNVVQKFGAAACIYFKFKSPKLISVSKSPKDKSDTDKSENRFFVSICNPVPCD